MILIPETHETFLYLLNALRVQSDASKWFPNNDALHDITSVLLWFQSKAVGPCAWPEPFFKHGLSVFTKSSALKKHIEILRDITITTFWFQSKGVLPLYLTSASIPNICTWCHSTLENQTFSMISWLPGIQLVQAFV